jgi:hypothetical protein
MHFDIRRVIESEESNIIQTALAVVSIDHRMNGPPRVHF